MANTCKIYIFELCPVSTVISLYIFAVCFNILLKDNRPENFKNWWCQILDSHNFIEMNSNMI